MIKKNTKILKKLKKETLLKYATYDEKVTWVLFPLELHVILD